MRLEMFMNQQNIAVVLVFASVSLAGARTASAEGWGTVKGRIVFTGSSLPEMPNLTVTKDQSVCVTARMKAGLGPLKEETLVVDPDTKGIGNVIVYLKARGTPAIHPSYPQSKDDVAAANAEAYKKAFGVGPDEIGQALGSGKLKIKDMVAQQGKCDVTLLDQMYCQYVPHALAIREGQRVLALNPEPIAHNVKVNSFFGNESNYNMPPGTALTYDWTAETVPLSLECNIHGWMKAVAMVFKHPYYAVSSKDGSFEIKNLPAGEIELVFRNPKYIVRSHKMTLSDGDDVTLEVSYDGDKGSVASK